jgi:hypothetical protein
MQKMMMYGNKNKLGFYAKNGFGMDSQKLGYTI